MPFMHPFDPSDPPDPPDPFTRNPLLFAWAAGFVDGDGCISISKCKSAYCKNPVYRLTLSLSQNCRSTLEHFRDIFGINASLLTVKRTKEQNKNVYHLRYDGIQALQMIRLLQPYLIRKHIEAAVALDAWCACSFGRRPGSKGLPESVWEARERYYKKLRRLK